MKTPRGKPPELVDLFIDMTGACMGILSSNAWKIVTFVAVRVMELIRAEWRLKHDPSTLLDKDIHQAWSAWPAPPSPHDDPKAEVIVSDSPESLFPTLWAARISLKEMCRGTGLAKSSAVEAVQEAVTLGVLKKAAQRSPRLDYMVSLYAIEWNWVLKEAKKAAKRRRRKLRGN